MFRVATILGIALTMSGGAAAQTPAVAVHVWNVSWREAQNASGTATRFPVFMWVNRRPQDVRGYKAPAEISAVVYLDERVRVARAARDARALGDLLSTDFYGTDATGWRFDRDMLLVVIGATTISDVKTLSSTLRTAGNAVTVTGEQLITDARGSDRTLFTRVYVRDAQTGNWQLFSSAEQAPGR